MISLKIVLFPLLISFLCVGIEKPIVTGEPEKFTQDDSRLFEWNEGKETREFKIEYVDEKEIMLVDSSINDAYDSITLKWNSKEKMYYGVFSNDDFCDSDGCTVTNEGKAWIAKTRDAQNQVQIYGTAYFRGHTETFQSGRRYFQSYLLLKNSSNKQKSPATE